MKKLNIAVLVAAALFAFSAQAETNLILNGGFETAGPAGYAAFQSQYAVTSAYYEGSINIGSDPRALHSYWSSFAPESGNGMLIINGALDTSKAFWSQTLNLSAGNYVFSASAASSYPAAPANLRAVAIVNGVSHNLGNLQLGSTTGQWSSFGGNLALSNNTTVSIKLFDQVPNGGGNDFVVDNITLTSPVPEPESWAMMLAGIGLLGALARRKRA